MWELTAAACESTRVRADAASSTATGALSAKENGQSVDILLDITNPGLWMAHCHIAEHHESGMMFSFRVDP